MEKPKGEVIAIAIDLAKLLDLLMGPCPKCNEVLSKHGAKLECPTVAEVQPEVWLM